MLELTSTDSSGHEPPRGLVADNPKRLIPLAEVSSLVGLGKSSIYSELADPTSHFPRPVRWGRSIRFVLGEVLAYIDGLIAQRDAGQKASPR